MKTKKISPQQIAQGMFLLGTFDDYSLEDMLLVLRAADDTYYNESGETFLTDEQYDTLRLFAHGLDRSCLFPWCGQ